MVAPRSHEYYRERSHHFLALVDGMLDGGEIELACEALWGAAAHAIKSASQRRGWEHGAHALLLVNVRRLVAEVGAPPHLLGQYGLASDFHVGFYGDLEFGSDNIRYGKQTVTEFIQILESLPPAQPSS